MINCFFILFYCPIIHSLAPRAMNKENQKLRDAGKREYVDSVKRLAEFIKRLDDRWFSMERRREALKKQREEQKRLELETRKAYKLKMKAEYAVCLCGCFECLYWAYVCDFSLCV